MTPRTEITRVANDNPDHAYLVSVIAAAGICDIIFPCVATGVRGDGEALRIVFELVAPIPSGPVTTNWHAGAVSLTTAAEHTGTFQSFDTRSDG